jgi:predicted AAA+ superfamily ATPase
LLRGYVDLSLLRDVMERHSVGHPEPLRWLVRQLLANAAGSFSVAKFYKDLKSQDLAVSKDALHAYVGWLEDAFLIRTVSIAADSVRRQMVNPRKVYPIDPALTAVFDRSGRANLGHALETSVYLALERRGAEIGYVRTASGFEVDFLARYPEGGEDLIQVCAGLDDPLTREREIRALLEAAREHPRAKLHLIALAPDPALDLPAKIKVHWAPGWLLAEAHS